MNPRVVLFTLFALAFVMVAVDCDQTKPIGTVVSGGGPNSSTPGGTSGGGGGGN
jgi:uncharacterized membrane protein YgcG